MHVCVIVLTTQCAVYHERWLVYAEAFMTALSNAMFDMHAPDIQECKARLVREGKRTPEEVERLPHAYFKAR